MCTRKILDHAHFCMIEATVTSRQEFLGERKNSKSNGADLAATYSYFDSYSGPVELRKFVL